MWKISLRISAEAEEAVAELLQRIFHQPASSFTDFRTGQTTVATYVARRPAWPRVSRRKLAAGLARMEACGLRIGPVKIVLEKVRREDWAEAWKRHFQAMEIGSALLLKPSWSRRRPRKGQAVVVLDPGLSFGTGRHPTTAFCLRQLVARRRTGQAQSFLDLGTGSGILAIAAARLGYAPVLALDSDREAVRIARANARQNGVSNQICFRHQDLARLPCRRAETWAVVCANLTAHLLLAERERILARLAPDGVLVLAGLLTSEFPGIQRAYEAAGLRLVASRAQGEWRSAAFRWRKNRR